MLVLMTAHIYVIRFDKHVEVPLPDVRGRLEILQLYAQKVNTISSLWMLLDVSCH